VLADPTSTPESLIRPGHVIPLRAHQGGVLARQGHTEATVDLLKLAGLTPVGVIAEMDSVVDGFFRKVSLRTTIFDNRLSNSQDMIFIEALFQ